MERTLESATAAWTSASLVSVQLSKAYAAMCADLVEGASLDASVGQGHGCTARIRAAPSTVDTAELGSQNPIAMHEQAIAQPPGLGLPRQTGFTWRAAGRAENNLGDMMKDAAEDGYQARQQAGSPRPDMAPAKPARNTMNSL